MTDHGDGDDRTAARKAGTEQDDPATQPDPGDADAPDDGQSDADD